ncbi:MAG: TetR/AcrR family transcriptional regulator [Acholeplasmatales bacterium]|jgi:AcrR family transcriptional regulator|nr:TetR/AcrR family transcriptional regulator [Acholeplasmatales bacterium]
MYTDLKNPSSFRSKFLISNALLELMKEENYKKISITSISQKAGIVRKTFYRNFGDKDDIIKFQVDTSMAHFLKFNNFDKMSFVDILLNSYSFLQNYKDFILLYYHNGILDYTGNYIAEYIIKNKLVFLFTKITSSKIPSYYYDYIPELITDMFNSIVKKWISNGFKETALELAKLNEDLIHGKLFLPKIN